MLTPIRRPGTRAANDPARQQAPDVQILLLACHERIRHFLALAGQLCESAAPAAEVAAAAAAVHRYFTVALPLHALDEDESLAPRLLRLDLPAAVRAAIGPMTAQHGPIEAAIEAAAPLWQALA